MMLRSMGYSRVVNIPFSLKRIVLRQAVSQTYTTSTRASLHLISPTDKSRSPFVTPKSTQKNQKSIMQWDCWVSNSDAPLITNNRPSLVIPGHLPANPKATTTKTSAVYPINYKSSRVCRRTSLGLGICSWFFASPERYRGGCIGRCLHLSAAGSALENWLPTRVGVSLWVTQGVLSLDETLVRQWSWWRMCLEVGHGRCWAHGEVLRECHVKRRD